MTSIYGNNTPIGAELLLRNNDVVSAKDETACKNKGWEWSEGVNEKSAVCLSPCPEGYTSAWDDAHGAICNRSSGADAQANAGIAREKEARQQVVADNQKKNTDVFVKDPVPASVKDSSSTILIDFGGGFRIDTQGLIALIALVYVITTRKSR
jgi:hypothetical protein